MQSVELDKQRHEREHFDCGVEALNNYLKLMANQQSSKDNSRTYVLESPENSNEIIGFYTLTMTSINLSLLPKKLQKNIKIIIQQDLWLVWLLTNDMLKKVLELGYLLMH